MLKLWLEGKCVKGFQKIQWFHLLISVYILQRYFFFSGKRASDSNISLFI